LGVDQNVTLKELKTIYRNAMKDTHPDKFINDEAGQLEAEEKSKSVIEAYHFLVSINPETQENTKKNIQKRLPNPIFRIFIWRNRFLQSFT
jgi:DnaJ-class molecular chaperone